MPGFDGSGPSGTGPVGRGMGPCGGGMAYRGRGRGFRGAGRGFFQPASSPETEKQVLVQQKSWLEQQLAAIADRLTGLEK